MSKDEEPIAEPTPASDIVPRASLPDLPLVAPSTTIESAAQNALIERVNMLSRRRFGSVGIATQSFAPATGIFTVAHTLGVAPSAILLTPALDSGFSLAHTLLYQVFDVGTEFFRVQITRITDATIVTDVQQRIAFYWLALA